VRDSNFIWLRTHRRLWIVRAELASTTLLIVAFIAGVLAGVGPGELRRTASIITGVALLSSLAAALAQHAAFYRAIRCPYCGHNPTKYKNGKNLPTSSAQKLLSTLHECPNCGAP
jgi:hypothetical protein